MKINKRTLCGCGIFLIILIAFSKSLFKTLYGGNTGAMIVLVVGISLILLSYSKRAKLHFKFTVFSLLWIIVLAIAISNNYDLKYGNIMAVVQLVVGTLLILLLQTDDLWCLSAIKIMKGFALFNLFTGVVLLFNKRLLIQHIVPLFHLDASSEYYSNQLLQQINNGYMTGLTSHYTTMGIYMSIGMCYFASSIFNDKDRIDKKDLIGTTIMLIGTFLSGKRSALLFPLISILLVYFSFFKPKNVSRRYNYIGIMVIISLTSILILSIVPELGGALGRVLDIFGSKDLNDITNKRYEMLWLPAIYLFLDSPIFGIGWGNFKYSFTKYYIFKANQNNTHNVYLQLLCETGIVGSITILGTMLASVVIIGRTLSAWRKEKIFIQQNQVMALGVSMAMQLYFFLYSLSGNPLYDIQCYLPYMISVAMGLATTRRVRIDNNRMI